MENSTIADRLFRDAVTALDNGDAEALRQLLQDNPGLAGQRLSQPDKGYFKHPYLLWFIADNPIRRERLAPNIDMLATILIDALCKNDPGSLKAQLDYALALVATGRIPKECGVQTRLIDLLIDAGATPGNGVGALAHGNPEAARQLIDRGGGMTLAAAAGLGLSEVVGRLLPQAEKEEKQLALVVAAFYGRTELLSLLMTPDVDLNSYPDERSGFHSHATALHQAVWSGSLETVQILVAAGANTALRDKVYGGTALGWAEHALQDTGAEGVERERYTRIADYLREMM